jgi:hypothetical protein
VLCCVVTSRHTLRNSLLLLSYASSSLFLFLQDVSAINQTRCALCKAATK